MLKAQRFRKGKPSHCFGRDSLSQENHCIPFIFIYDISTIRSIPSENPQDNLEGIELIISYTIVFELECILVTQHCNVLIHFIIFQIMLNMK